MRRLPNLLRILTCTTLLVPAGSISAQDHPPLATSPEPGTPALDEVAVLSFAGVDVAPDFTARVFPLPGGGFGVTSEVFGGEIRLFGADGAYTGAFGREGEGPGEFGGSSLYGVMQDNRVWLVDAANQRLHVLSHDSTMGHLHERRLPAGVLDVSPSRRDSSILASGRFVAGETSGSLAWLGRDASEDRFGGEARSIPDVNSRVNITVSAETSGGEIWSFAKMGGDVLIYDAETLAVIDRRNLGEPFQSVAPPGRLDIMNSRPHPIVNGVMADGEQLWVVLGIADSDWRAGLTPSEIDGATTFYDTAVLRILPGSRQIAGKHQLEDMCTPMQDGLISCVEELNERIRIFRLRPAGPAAPDPPERPRP